MPPPSESSPIRNEESLVDPYIRSIRKGEQNPVISPPPANSDDGVGSPLSAEQIRAALNDLYIHSYAELRRRASAFRRRNPSLTLGPTALLNTAWLKLASQPHLEFKDKNHLKRILDKAMKDILVDAARRRGADKRGNGVEIVCKDPDETAGPARPYSFGLLALEFGLDVLEKLNPRQAEIVRGIVYEKMTTNDLAERHGVSVRTIEREWRVARAWLAVRNRPKVKE